MSGFIYAVQSHDAVKIGWSGNPERRFIKIAADCSRPCQLLGYIEGGSADEADIHVKFSHLRTHGEWFTASDELLQFVAHWPRPAPVKKRRGRSGRFKSGSNPSALFADGVTMTLDQYLSETGMTETEFGARAGLTQPSVNRLRHRKMNPDLGTMRRIAEATGGKVAPNDFLTEQPTSSVEAA
jgi:Meiotically up-regulated gene 113